MWKFLFGGRLNRLQYALIAIPLLALQYFTPAISMYAPAFFAKVFEADLITFPGYMIAMTLVLDVFILILTLVSAKRLRDIGLTGWLALPVLLKLGVGTVFGFLKVQAVTDAAVDQEALHILTWTLHGFHYYSLALALFLLIMPGRRRQAGPTELALAL